MKLSLLVGAVCLLGAMVWAVRRQHAQDEFNGLRGPNLAEQFRALTVPPVPKRTRMDRFVERYQAWRKRDAPSAA